MAKNNVIGVYDGNQLTPVKEGENTNEIHEWGREIKGILRRCISCGASISTG